MTANAPFHQTKLSNNNTNATKNYTNEIKGAEKNGRTVTKLGDRAEIRDSSGNLLKVLIKPTKRTLNEFLPPDLAQSPAAKVKKARGSRWGTGASPAAAAAVVTPANAGSPAPAQNVASNALPAIQEEEEPVGAPDGQGNPAGNTVEGTHSNGQQFGGNQNNAAESHTGHPGARSLNPRHTSTIADQSQPDMNHMEFGDASYNNPSFANPSASFGGMYYPNMSNRGLNNSALDHGHTNSGYIHNMHRAYQNNAPMGFNNTVPSASQNPIGQTSVIGVRPPMSFASYQDQFRLRPSQYAPQTQFHASHNQGTLRQAPGSSARVNLSNSSDPLIASYNLKNTSNGDSEAGWGQSGGAVGNTSGSLSQYSGPRDSREEDNAYEEAA